MNPSSQDLLNTRVRSSYKNRSRIYTLETSRTEFNSYPAYLEKFGSLVLGENFYLIDNHKQLEDFIKFISQKAFEKNKNETTKYTVMYSHEMVGVQTLFELEVVSSKVNLIFFRSRNTNSFSTEESSIYAVCFKYFSSKKLYLESIHKDPTYTLRNQDIALLLNFSEKDFEQYELDRLSEKALNSKSNTLKVDTLEYCELLKRSKLLDDAPLSHKLYEFGSAIFSNNCKNQTVLALSQPSNPSSHEYVKLVGYLGFLIGGLMIYPVEYVGIICGLTLSIFSPLFVGRKGFSIAFNTTTAIAFVCNWKAASMFAGALITVGGEDFLEFYINNVISPVEEYFRGTEPSIPIQTI